jgi:hypothetical protein
VRAHRPRRSVRRLCERSFPASSRRRLAICGRLEPRSSREPLAFDASELGVDKYELWADRFHNGQLSNRQRRSSVKSALKPRSTSSCRSRCDREDRTWPHRNVAMAESLSGDHRHRRDRVGDRRLRWRRTRDVVLALPGSRTLTPRGTGAPETQPDANRALGGDPQPGQSGVCGR